MNKQQINLLKKNDYEVLPDIGYIKEISMLHPMAYIWFNNLTKKFKLCIIGTEVDYDELDNYSQELNNKIQLIKSLADLGDDK